MKPDIFPNEEIKKLYENIEKEIISDKKRFEKLKKFNLVSIFKYDNKTLYVFPNHQWKTYMFRIPIYSSDKIYERTNRSRYIAFKNIIVKWIFGKSIEEHIDEEFYSKLKTWFAKHMTGYATISIPENISNEFEQDFKKTQNKIINITPNIKKITCTNCNHQFISKNNSSMAICNNCGFSFII